MPTETTIGQGGAWRMQPCGSRSSPAARALSLWSSANVVSSPAASIILRNAGLRSSGASPPLAKA